MLELSLAAAVLIAVLAAITWYLNRQIQELKKPKTDETMTEWLKTMSRDISDTKKVLNETLSDSTRHLSESLTKQTHDIHERLTKAAEVIGELKRETGSFSEIGRSMKELHEFLKSPKLRGNIGEQVLNDLIAQMIPQSSFYLQYQFVSGDKVDAAIKTDAGILPIDSKFPMENFQKMNQAEEKSEREKAGKEFVNDVKKHIRAISSKYVLPDEGTTDFAMMYIPSESVYYEIATNPDLMDYSRNLRIYPVSPNTMYATLSIIMRAFQGKQFASRSRQILNLLRAVEKDYGQLEDSLNILGGHINNAYNKFSDVSGHTQRLGQKITSTVSFQEIDQPKLLQ
ncbi:DNA recombination protein RmuC [Candidatus Collierbacteria bacterium]|nr:DNA recombination protein RmuC [Candidatus Collierbacteria bacterium]